jgi:outer membrane protein OmpA-like peptidoglycan-associated protein
LNQILVNNFEYDGFTKTMSATCYLKPWKLYHLKIAIGDVGDRAFDSGVFLKKGSLSSSKDTAQKGFKDYADLYDKMNWDSIFNKIKKVQLAKQDSNSETEYNKFQVSNFNFSSGDFTLSDSAKQGLDLLAAYLLKNQSIKCQLRGYTDNTGSKKKNQKLSENRALAVMYYLTTKGIERTRLNYIGCSSENPIESNNTENGRAQNRRVEIILIEGEQ